MRFSTALFVALSLLLSHVAATPGLEIRQNAAVKQKGGNKGNNGQGGNGGNNNNKNGGNNNGNNGGNNSTNGGNNNTNGGNNNTNGGNNGNNGGNGGDIQSSLTLDPSVIASGFANNGQSPPVAGQVASLTSTNNFINFCATVQLPITNGLQIKSGSCNPAPMGTIPSTDNMPSAKFVFPKNLDNIDANTNFTIQMAIRGMATGFFVNAEENYFAAPQQLNSGGQIIGHSHVVIELIDSIDSTTTSDPNVFAFFKGLNAPAQNGILTATVANGLPAGTYKMSSINTASNHQPCLVPIAQHGSLDDAVYFTVGGAANDATGQVTGASAAGNDQNNAQSNGTATATGNANANGQAGSNGKANGKTATNGNTKNNTDNTNNAANTGNNATGNAGGTGAGAKNTKGNNKSGGGKQNARRFSRAHRRFAHDSY
jgi:hypothetical protein